MSSAPSVWILAAGVFDMALALFHLCFWRLFGWPGSLQPSGRVNRSVTQILNFAITYVFVLASLLCFLFPGELAATALGRFWLLAMAVFWLARALLQPVFFGLRHPLSATLFAVFLLGAVLHAAIGFI
jgi:hypothetical protein